MSERGGRAKGSSGCHATGLSRGVVKVGAVATAALLLVPFGSCRGVDTRVHWYFERMIIQPKYLPFATAPFFADGRVMRTPPGGTVPRGTIIERAPAGEGAGTTFPIGMTIEMLEIGRKRFDITCAPCHGIAGDGASAVAMKMQLRRPPSLHEEVIREYSPGRLYQVVVDGYGLMPSHATLLTWEERWAVVAYVKALQLSQRALVSDLPEPVRGEIARQLAGEGR